MAEKFVFTNKSGVLLMRLSRFVMLCLVAAGLNACGADQVTTPTLPPLASVRYINAVNDTAGVDIHPIDLVSMAVANNLQYRKATEYFPTEAGVRHFRVFPTSTNIDVTSQVLLDQEVTLPEGTRATLLLTGSAKAGTLLLWVILDSTDPPPADDIGIRLVNTATAVVNGYITARTSSPLLSSPTWSNVVRLTPTGYVLVSADSVAVQVTGAGSSIVAASSSGPDAPATLTGELPAAGMNSPGTLFSAYYFAAGAAGTSLEAVSASVVWFVDRNPCDEPLSAFCSE
jgi:hypothetical protein